MKMHAFEIKSITLLAILKSINMKASFPATIMDGYICTKIINFRLFYFLFFFYFLSLINKAGPKSLIPNLFF